MEASRPIPMGDSTHPHGRVDGPPRQERRSSVDDVPARANAACHAAPRGVRDAWSRPLFVDPRRHVHRGRIVAGRSLLERRGADGGGRWPRQRPGRWRSIVPSGAKLDLLRSRHRLCRVPQFQEQRLQRMRASVQADADLLQEGRHVHLPADRRAVPSVISARLWGSGDEPLPRPYFRCSIGTYERSVGPV